ncbi:MAG TPA: hypothetical protein VHB25_21745 [Gemmatimonadaceae bacterium]|nr:hypothetical protein [Gemmatimonadaceae bacterium]
MSAARIGRTDLGTATVVFEDDALVVIVGVANEEPVRVPFAAIESVRHGERAIELSLRDGTRVELASDGLAEVRNELLLRCCALPELTRTLRAFGSRRGSRGLRATCAADQQRFFAPLLAARRAADAVRPPASALDAFDASRLSSEIDATLAAFAASRFGANAPARRALHAELVDASEPLRDALLELARLADVARSTTEDLRAWRSWSDQLRAVFETADRAWLALDAALDRGMLAR